MSSLLASISTALAHLTRDSGLDLPISKSSKGLHAEITKIWGTIPSVPSLDVSPQDPSSSDGQAEKKKLDKNIEITRGALEAYGREVVVDPLVRETTGGLSTRNAEEMKALVQEVQSRLNVALTLFEVVFESHPTIPLLEPGALFIPLLEELVELLSVDAWRSLWPWIEASSKRFTKNMPASRGKALPLLRIINAFLRFLPRTPEYLVFRGRIHHFASSVIGIAERSAVNFRGDYADVKTSWEEFVPVEETPTETLEGKAVEVEKAVEGGEVEKDGDVKMDDSDGQPPKEEDAKPTEDLYSTLWSLQQYFASPPLLGRPSSASPDATTWEDFRKKSDFVLPRLFEQTKKQVEMQGKEDDPTMMGGKRKRDVEDEGFFHPRYLTPRRLFEHQLGDHGFRRQILSQYCILFQFLLNLTPASKAKQSYTGGMPKDFVIDEAKEKWIKATVQGIRDDLKKMPGDGVLYEQTFMSIINNEHHYARWKNEQCPESAFEKPAADRKELDDALAQWKKPLAGLQKWRIKLGTRALQNVADQGRIKRKNLTAKPVKTWREIGEEIKELKEEETKDLENQTYYKEKAESLNWTALRLAAKSDLKSFQYLRRNRSVVVLQTSMDNALKAEEAEPVSAFEEGDVDMTPQPSGVGTPQVEEETSEVQDANGDKEIRPQAEEAKEEDVKMEEISDVVVAEESEPSEDEVKPEPVPAA